MGKKWRQFTEESVRGDGGEGGGGILYTKRKTKVGQSERTCPTSSSLAKGRSGGEIPLPGSHARHGGISSVTGTVRIAQQAARSRM